MDSILRTLAKDNLKTITETVVRNPHYDIAMKEICELEEHLKETLNAQEWKLLERLEDLQMEVSAISSEQNYIHGYQLGSLTMVEVFSGRVSFQEGGEEPDAEAI